MPYEQSRDQEQLGVLDKAIDSFIVRYLANPSTTDRKTIFLFPGGIGSHLLRAETCYLNGPPFYYDTVWLDCSLFFHATLGLQMHGVRDSGDRIIIADGFVEFGLFNIRPYNGFIDWCNLNGIDWFVFGWEATGRHREFLRKSIPAAISTAGL